MEAHSTGREKVVQNLNLGVELKAFLKKKMGSGLPECPNGSVTHRRWKDTLPLNVLCIKS